MKTPVERRVGAKLIADCFGDGRFLGPRCSTCGFEAPVVSYQLNGPPVVWTLEHVTNAEHVLSAAPPCNVSECEEVGPHSHAVGGSPMVSNAARTSREREAGDFLHGRLADGEHGASS